MVYLSHYFNTPYCFVLIRGAKNGVMQGIMSILATKKKRKIKPQNW